MKNRLLVTLAATTILFSSASFADQATDPATAVHAEECKAYAEMEQVKEVQRRVWVEACMAELKRLDNAETNATDYAYNH